jgi:hypothetical protein
MAIGGYTPRTMSLSYLYGLTADGKIDMDSSELASVCIQYDNKHEPGAEIFVNLLAKLEAQYGEFTRYIGKDLTSRTYKEMYDVIKNSMSGAKQYTRYELGKDIYLSACAICTLRGKNNTGIMLKMDNGGSVTLFYAKTDMYDRIEAIQKILESEPVNTGDVGI